MINNEIWGDIKLDVSIIFQIAAIGIITAITNQVLKYSGKDEIATLTTLAGVIIVLVMVVNMINELFETVKQLFSLY